MRGFLILCLVAVTAAGKLGYDYRPASGVGGLDLGRGGLGSISSGGSSFSGGIGTGLASGHGSSLGGGVGGGLGGGLGGGVARALSVGGDLSSGSYSSGLSVGSAPVVTEFNKEYYFHAAPEEEIQDGGSSQRVTSTLKKNLRVIFIKAPENNGLTKAALQIARQATEDRTAIYVLTKENDVTDLSQQLHQIQEIRAQKPEVRFVKYRTAEDAINAQRAIQAQYDALGGSSRSSDEGIAPVLNYASSNPIGSNSLIGSSSHHHSSTSELSSAGSVSSGALSLSAPSGSHISPKNSYLPPVSF